MASNDLLPTFVALAGGSPAADRAIDGVDQSAFITGAGDSARDTFCYFHRGSLEAVRKGRWKLHLRKDQETICELYDLVADVAETDDRAADEPTVVAELRAIAEAAKAELGDLAEGIDGTAVRPKGVVAEHDSLTHYNPDHPYVMAEYDLADGG
jgi:arylsulfatase A-like enzyme